MHHIFIETVETSDTFSLEQEDNALQILKQTIYKNSSIDDSEFDRYLTTGIIKYKSKKSNLTYYVRKLRPTLVFKENWDNKDRKSHDFITSLCFHPLGYYLHSFVGCLCPTDDVIAHLKYILADEARYWKVAHAHSINHVEAGIP